MTGPREGIHYFLFSKDDYELRQLLEEYGVKVASSSGGPNDERLAMVMEEAVNQAGLSFRFFQAFATLTKPNDDQWKSAASRLLSKRSKSLSIGDLLSENDISRAIMLSYLHRLTETKSKFQFIGRIQKQWILYLIMEKPML